MHSEYTDGPNRVLVIENESGALAQIKIVLERARYDVLTARTLDAGLDIIKTARPHLIIMSENLSGAGGHQLFSDLKTDPCGAAIPVIMLGKRGGCTEMAHHAQADGFISKPFQPDSLVKLVTAFLPRRLQ